MALKVTVTTAGANTKPTISNLSDATVNEDQALGPVGFTIGDQETQVGSLTLSATSSNTALVPVSAIVFAGSGATRTVRITPATNLNGKSTIMVSVSDGSLSASTYLVLTVNAVNDAPTLITPIPDQTATINQDFSYVVPAGTFNDPEASALTWTANGLPPGIVFAPATRTLSGKPTAAGVWTVVITVSDGSLTTTDEFIITVGGAGGGPIKINFQPQSAPTVFGCFVDGGRAFGPRSGTGYSYGWNHDMPENTRDRNSSQSADQLRDTLILTQRIADSTWEIAVPNGNYLVRIVAGDAEYYGSDIRYSYAVEGVVVVQGTPTSTNRWVDDTDPITVADGRLTLTNGPTANRNRLCFIEITNVTGVSRMGLPARDVGAVAGPVSAPLPWDIRSLTPRVFSITTADLLP